MLYDVKRGARDGFTEEFRSVVAVVGTILGAGGASSSAMEGGTVGLIGLLLTLLLAFIAGGYVAGCLASRSRLKHGLLVPPSWPWWLR
jgi:hypothetical protein